MFKTNNTRIEKLRSTSAKINHPDGMSFFHFKLSEKGHEIVLPVEEDTAWEKLHEITWDPGRGD